MKSIAHVVFRAGQRAPCWAAVVVLLSGTFHQFRPVCCLAQDQQDMQTGITLNGRVTIARLLDLCASRLDCNIHYDASLVSGEVTLRLEKSLSDEELWELTNQLLSMRGLTTIRLADERQDGTPTFSVVRTADAGALAEVRTLSPEADTRPVAGYQAVVVTTKEITAGEVVDTLKSVLSRTGSSIQVLGPSSDSHVLLLADTGPRISQAMAILKLLDVTSQPATVRRVDLRYLSATRVATAISAVTLAQEQVDKRAYQGKVLADPGEGAVLIVAPECEMEYWTGLVEQFDTAPQVLTRSYAPAHFPIGDVARLIEETVKPTTTDRGETGRQWRLVQDTLTNTLIVTATEPQHVEIAALIDRLDSVPAESRRPVRTYLIRNRPVSELIGVLEQLLSNEALDEHTMIEADEAGAPSDTSSGTTNAVPPNNERGTTVGAGDSGTLGRNRSSTTNPSISLTADEATNSLIAIGEPRMLAQLEALIARLDVRQTQVMVEVLIVSLNEGQTLDLGVELEKLEISGSTLFRLSSLFGLSTSSGDSSSQRSRDVGDASGGTAVILHPGDFSVVVRALETLNHGKSLNIPRVLVNNNEQASLNSVIQEPFLATNASDTVATTSLGGTSNAGTVVQVTPHISGGDHLVLEYSVSLSTFVGESADPGLPPPRQENSLSSVATAPDSFIVALGGLEVTREAEAVSAVPVISHVPLVGELFKSRSKSRSQSRFYVFIRPTILRSRDFESLRYLSQEPIKEAGIDDGWPVVEPRIIR